MRKESSPIASGWVGNPEWWEAVVSEQLEYYGELDGGVEGDRVWMTCTCGATINRDADRD